MHCKQITVVWIKQQTTRRLWLKNTIALHANYSYCGTVNNTEDPWQSKSTSTQNTAWFDRLEVTDCSDNHSTVKLIQGKWLELECGFGSGVVRGLKTKLKDRILNREPETDRQTVSYGPI